MKTLNLKYFACHDFDLYGSRDVIGLVTIGLGICGLLLVVHWLLRKQPKLFVEAYSI